ncbi:hypothetical protein [Pseudomonas gessardii]|uniref:hypothetical protein n=1 Tax=Pseudomonas gessardii TaxID=78544 RepID=UPI001FD0ED2D|nr:hypothetical protein [Pseudomonas gessardii]
MKAQGAAQKVPGPKTADTSKPRLNRGEQVGISRKKLPKARDALSAASNSLAKLQQQLNTSTAYGGDTVISVPPDAAAR